MGRSIKDYRSPPDEEDSRCCHCKESCIWFLYALVSLSLGLAVLTFWLSLYKEQERSYEVFQLEKSYNDSVQSLASKLSQVRLIALQNQKGRDLLAREFKDVKSQNKAVRMRHFQAPHLAQSVEDFKRTFEKEIKETNMGLSEEIEDLRKKVNFLGKDRVSYVQTKDETDHSQSALIEDNRHFLSLLNGTLLKLTTRFEGMKSHAEWIEDIKDNWSVRAEEIDDIRREIIELESREQNLVSAFVEREEKLQEKLLKLEKTIQGGEDRIQEHMSTNLETLRVINETLRKDIMEDNISSSNVNSLIEDLRLDVLENIHESAKNVTEKIKKNNGSALKRLHQELSESKRAHSASIDNVNRKVGHFVRNLIKLKNIPGEIVVLKDKIKNLETYLR